jgi:hypothetical protein
MSEESDMVTAYLYAAELAKDAMKKLKAENEQLKAEFQKVYGVEIPQGFCYRNYVLLKSDLSEANKQISALKLSLRNSEREVLSMRAKTEHLPEFESMEVERLNIQIRNLTYQRKELMKKVEKLEFEVYQKRNRGS